MKVGDKKDITVTFPKDYHAENLAGKKAVFAVALHEIRAHRDVVLNDEMAKEIGFPSFESCANASRATSKATMRKCRARC